MALAAVAKSPTIMLTRSRDSGRKCVNITENTHGMMPPPNSPWTARNATAELMSQASAQRTDPTVKPPAHIVNIQRIESTRRSHPEIASITTSAIRNDVMTQLTSSGPASRPDWMCRNADARFCTPIRFRNMPPVIAQKARRPEGVSPPTSIAGGRTEDVLTACAPPAPPPAAPCACPPRPPPTCRARSGS